MPRSTGNNWIAVSQARFEGFGKRAGFRIESEILFKRKTMVGRRYVVEGDHDRHEVADWILGDYGGNVRRTRILAAPEMTIRTHKEARKISRSFLKSLRQREKWDHTGGGQIWNELNNNHVRMKIGSFNPKKLQILMNIVANVNGLDVENGVLIEGYGHHHQETYSYGGHTIIRIYFDPETLPANRKGLTTDQQLDYQRHFNG